MSTTPSVPHSPRHSSSNPNPRLKSQTRSDSKPQKNAIRPPAETSVAESTPSNPESGRIVEMSGSARRRASVQQEAEPEESGHRVAILLLILLVISVGMNFSLAQQQQATAARSAELAQALARATERIDQETQRANNAEGSLAEVDRSVDTVQQRITDLQSALFELSKATTR